MRTYREDTDAQLAQYDARDWRTPAEVEGADPQHGRDKVRILTDRTTARDGQERGEAARMLLERATQHKLGRLHARDVCVRRWQPGQGVRVYTTLAQWDAGEGYTEAEWARRCEGLT